MQLTILDGSIGQELVKRHGSKPTPYWSTMVMLEKPELVAKVHAEYFAAGAQIATTNSYPVLPDRLTGSGFEERLEELLGQSGKLAAGARDEHGSGRVAGSLGPLRASYRTDFEHTVDQAREQYGRIINALDPSVDFYIAETVASLSQLRNLVDSICTFSNKPGWIALTVDDTDGTKLRSGEPLEQANSLLAEPHIEAVLINCSRPEAVTSGVKVISEFGKPFGAYANGFTQIDSAFLEDSPTVDVLESRVDLDPVQYAEFARQWIGMGATIVGGCCEVGPAHIAELAKLSR